jgi:hypothetical protein
MNDRLRIRPAEREDADPIARLFLASKATLTFLPTSTRTRRPCTSSPTSSCAIRTCTSPRRTVRSAASSPCTETWWSISTSARISCAAASVARCSGEPWSACRRGSGCGSSWRTFRRGALRAPRAPAHRTDRWQRERGTDAGRPLRVEAGRPVVQADSDQPSRRTECRLSGSETPFSSIGPMAVTSTPSRTVASTTS